MSVAIDLRRQALKSKAIILQRFFKTAPGQYGAGDQFLGVTVPIQRAIAKKHLDLNFLELEKLLHSKFHEERLTALLILVEKFKIGDQEKIFRFYLKNTRYINNWDLVDLSADKICGAWLMDKDKKILYTLAKSRNLWERRIAMLSCFHFIKNNEFKDALKLAKILLTDDHDLIHKAVGWMLREIGKRNLGVEIAFLEQYATLMPRTMLRYAIEKFPEAFRQKFLKMV